MNNFQFQFWIEKIPLKYIAKIIKKMNKTNNFTYEFLLAYVNEDTFLTRVGTRWWIDGIYLFVVCPLSLLGIILNFVSLFVLYQMNGNKFFIFKILKVYCINSIIILIIAFFSFYVGSPRYIGFRLDYIARTYYCVIINYTGITFYLIGNVLDIIIIIERSSLKPFSTYIFLVIICHIIDIPCLFWYYVKNDEQMFEDLVNSYLTSKFYGRCGRWFLFGNFPSYISNIIIRDVLTLLLEVIFTLLTLYYFIKFQTKKAILLSYDKNESILINKKEESRMSSMSLYLTATSILSHMATFITSISLLIYESAFASTFFIMAAIVIISFKHSSNFFIFYLFNKKFKISMINYFNYEKNMETA
jgi:hypothetical protein